MMKKARLSKIISALAVAVLFVSSVVALGLSASAAEAQAQVKSANIAFNESTHIAIGVEYSGLAENQSVGIVVWEDMSIAKEDLTLANATYTNYDISTDAKGVEYFKTDAVASDEYAKEMWVAAVIKTDGVEAISGEAKTVSVLKYLSSRLDDTNVTAAQAALYSEMLLHGLAADKRLGDCEYSFGVVKTVGGNIGSGLAYVANAAVGETVTIRASAKTEDGYFLRWEAADGTVLSTSRIAKAPVSELGVNEYTAVYGAKKDSLYASTFNVGDYFGDGDIYFLPSGSARGNNAYWTTTMTTDAYEMNKYYATDAAKGTYFSPDVITAEDYFSVENAGANKVLAFEKNQTATGNSLQIKNCYDSAATYAEFDLSLRSCSGNFRIILTYDYTDAAGVKTADKTMEIYVGKSGSAMYFEDSQNKTADFYKSIAYGESLDYITIGINPVINTATVDGVTTDSVGLELYVGGELLVTSAAGTKGTSSTRGESDSGTPSVSVKRITFFFLKDGRGEAAIGNVSFMK